MIHPYDDYEAPDVDPTDEDAWLRERYPAVSADFVENTLARVMADRQEVTEEAEKVEEIQFDAAFLEHVQAPAVSPGFVDRLLAEVMAQHRRREFKDQALQQLMSKYKVPQTSMDFVRRTLSALGLRAGRRRRPVSRRRGLAWAAAAALLLALPLVLGPWQPGSAATQHLPTAVYTPVRFGSVMAAAAEQQAGFRLRGPQLGDGLVTLAYLGRR